MNRQEAKELLPIIQAFAEGKTIQYHYMYTHSLPQWEDVLPGESVDFSSPSSQYRIKPEPKYRPFKNKEECWQEILKHHPIGWVKDIPNNNFYSITEVTDNACIFTDGFRLLFNDGYKYFTFIDGTPFGIKE